MTRLIDADAIPWIVEGVGEIPVVTKEEIDELPTIQCNTCRDYCTIYCPYNYKSEPNWVCGDWHERKEEMTYKELYDDAMRMLEHNEINGGEFDKMIEPLNAEVGNAEPVRHGKWMKHMKVVHHENFDSYTPWWQCSECGQCYDPTFANICNYCYYCGAKMERKEE